MKRVLKAAIVALLGAITAALLAPVAAWAAVTCGAVITTNTVLTSDLDCPGTGLTIGAPNIVLDLGGHTISGRQADEPRFHGVTLREPGAVVRNGTIRGFDRGVAVNPRASNALVTGLTLDANGLGIAVFTDTATGVVPSGVRIVQNRILNTTRFSGIQLGGDHHRVEANEISNGANAGILLFGSDNLIQGNTITDSGAAGIAINPVPGNPGPFRRNQIVGNTITGSGRVFVSSAVSIRAADATEVRTNTLVGRGSTPGIFLQDSSNTLISGNRISNHSTGVLVRGNSAGTRVERNVVERNGSGILVESPATGTLLLSNTVSDNRFNGISVEAPGTTVTANTAYRNGQWGIYAVQGVVDGGGNRAFTNGVPAQCTPNIVCT